MRVGTTNYHGGDPLADIEAPHRPRARRRFTWAVALLVSAALGVTGCGSGPTSTTVTAATGTTATTTTSAASDTVTVTTTGEVSVNDSDPRVELITSMGTIVVDLNATAAPVTVANFLSYVQAGFYDGTIFHRVIPGFMAQGGGFAPDMKQKTTNAPIKNEAGNGLKNLRGTLAMARTGVVDSATAQFFINVVDNASLDHKADTNQGYGYAVFAKVVSGLDVVDAMVAAPTTTTGPFQDVPVTPIVIESAKLLGNQ